MLEEIERKRVTELKSIEAEKVIEVQKKEIQEVIRERVAVEKGVVEEQQRIKDTEEFATADRFKQVTVTTAEANAEEQLIRKLRKLKLVRKRHNLRLMKRPTLFSRKLKQRNRQQRCVLKSA
jgi:uncharacterized membrane protein YqiK